MKRNQKTVYIAILITNFIFLLIGLVYWFMLRKTISFRTCAIYRWTGLYCPACGGTRALDALLHGEIFYSLYCNGFVLYALGMDILYLVVMTIFLFKKKSFPYPWFGKFMIGAGLFILLFNCILHNLFGF